MATTLTNFVGQNWLITPAAPVVGDLHRQFFDQTWLLVLTGIVEADLQGNSTSQWLNETVTFLPSGLLYTSDFDLPPVGQGPLFWVLNKHGIQRPPLHEYTVCFSLQDGGWAPFVCAEFDFRPRPVDRRRICCEQVASNPLSKGSKLGGPAAQLTTFSTFSPASLPIWPFVTRTLLF